MHRISEKLKSAISYIEDNRKKVEQSATSLRARENAVIDGTTENGLVKPIIKGMINGTVCAIDGGLACNGLHEIDLFISRAVGVAFEYSDSNLVTYRYYPSKIPEPEADVKMAMDESAVRVYGSLFRLRHELDTALACIEQFKPKVLFIDGSLAVHPADKPGSDNKEMFGLYEEIVGKYAKLYAACEQSNCLLIGISKDSRAKRFGSIVNENWTDTLFLDYLLKEGERTVALKYYGKESNNPAPKMLVKWADKLKLAYVKCSNNDYPLRIEFISDDCDLVASTVLSLAAINKSYAYPAILIEADLRAMLNENDVNSILDLFTARTKPLRSRARPFR